MLRFLTLTFAALSLFAQDRIGTVQVRVSTERPDWLYEPGQPVRFRIVAVQDGHPLSGVTVSYRIGPEMMPPVIEQTATLPAEGLVVEGGTMKEPGFLRCIATVERNGRTYRGLATAALRPEAIQPTQQDPADFDAFWAAGKAALAKLPIDAKLTPLPEYGNAGADCFHLNLQNVGFGTAPSRFYGILCEPKAPGKYPAVLAVPGAGVRPYRGMAAMAARGVITLQVGIHGIPVTMDQSVYDSLGAGALANYNTIALDSRDRYYYRRVYLGCVRANDYLTSHPKWDGVHLAVTGGSQGGALSIITAALDPRVKGLAAYFPALSDVTGYLQNRAGGWPHMFRATEGLQAHRSPEKIETSRYYDVVNFARRLKVPGFYSWGFNDEVCPPTSMYAAYNVITAPKKLLLALETGHNNVPEQVAEVDRWLEALVKGAASN
ncbi:MAG: acetylxylan esterase [Acidobacteria bacterium]|nr:acetylxylan esterase [Acidobacteriota bacterium]